MVTLIRFRVSIFHIKFPAFVISFISRKYRATAHAVTMRYQCLSAWGARFGYMLNIIHEGLLLFFFFFGGEGVAETEQEYFGRWRIILF